MGLAGFRVKSWVLGLQRALCINDSHEGLNTPDPLTSRGVAPSADIFLQNEELSSANGLRIWTQE